MREPVRSDTDARRRYVNHLNISLSCVTSSTIWRVGEASTPGCWLLLFSSTPITLSRGLEQGPLYLNGTQVFHYADDSRYPGERKVVTDEYAYTLAEDDGLTDELFGWHWQPAHGHPDPHIRVEYPNPLYPRSTKWHVPGGRVAFEQVLAFAIYELGVQPARADAAAVLEEKLSLFRRFATWGVPTPPPE